MDENVRKGIHFDLDTNALKKYHPSKNWRKAYDDVRVFMEDKGFVHEQGSGYHSNEPMSESDALYCIQQMRKRHVWLHKCVKVCTIADVPVTYDISAMFDKSRNVPERDNL
jgi:virulence-associated protein VapD